MDERMTVHDESGNEVGYIALDAQTGFWIAVNASGIVVTGDAWTAREARLCLLYTHSPEAASRINNRETAHAFEGHSLGGSSILKCRAATPA